MSFHNPLAGLCCLIFLSLPVSAQEPYFRDSFESAEDGGGVTVDGGFPTIWGLSKRRFNFFANSFVVDEDFVVAFADGTYSENMLALFDENIDPPGTGERQGEWKIENGELLTRFGDPDAEFRPQFFSGFRTRPGTAGLRLSGCYSGTEIVLVFTFRKICFDTDGTYRREEGSLVGGVRQSGEGTYSINGYRLTLDDSTGERSRTGFAVLVGEPSAPSSIVIGNERFSD